MNKSETLNKSLDHQNQSLPQSNKTLDKATAKPLDLNKTTNTNINTNTSSNESKSAVMTYDADKIGVSIDQFT